MKRFLAFAALWLALASGSAQASQANQVTPGPPLPMTGLKTFLDSALQAIGTCNSGPSAPTVGPAGAPIATMCWWNTVTTPWVLNYWDGSQWVPVYSINPSTHAAAIAFGALPTLNPGQVLGNSGTAPAAAGAVNLFGAVAPVGGLPLFAAPTATGTGNCLSSGNACTLATACSFVKQIATFLGGAGPINLADGTYSTLDAANALCTIPGNQGGSSNFLATIIGNLITPTNVILAVPNNGIGLNVLDAGEATINSVEITLGTNAQGIAATRFALVDYRNVSWGTSGSGSTHVLGTQNSAVSQANNETILANFNLHWHITSGSTLLLQAATVIPSAVTEGAFLTTGGDVNVDASGWSSSGSGVAGTTGPQASLVGLGYLVTPGNAACGSVFPGTPNSCSLSLGFQVSSGEGMTGTGILVGQTKPTIADPIITAHTYAGLPGSPTAGQISHIIDGLAANCGDGACTTPGATITGGGGALDLLVGWDGATWRIFRAQAVPALANLSGTLAVNKGGTNCSTASGICLDNITGFSSTGFIKRTGAGTYTFTADPSDVTSVFGRVGAVVAAANDYNFNQIAGAATTGQLPGSGVTTINGQPCTIGSTCTVTAPSYYLSGNWYLPFGPPQQAAGAATSANTIYCTFSSVSAPVTIKALGAYLITGILTDVAQLAVYSQSGGTLTLVDKTGNITAGTVQNNSTINGAVSNTTDALVPGVLYAFCENSQGAMVFATPNAATALGLQPMFIGSSSQAAVNLPGSGAAALVGRSIAQTYGTWPGTIAESGMADVTTNLPPIISFQVN